MRKAFRERWLVVLVAVLVLLVTTQCRGSQQSDPIQPTPTEPLRAIQPTFTSTPQPTPTAPVSATPLPTATAPSPAAPPPASTPSLSTSSATRPPSPTLSPTPMPTATPSEGFGGPYYGVHYVPMEDLAKVKALGADVVLRDIPDHGTPEEWLAILDEFEANDLKLLAWFWEEGWTWDDDSREWTINDQARLFLETVAGHPALFAVYMLHEPYWNNCFGCGYTTKQQQKLYRQIKEIADVPLYSTPGELALWDKRGPDTRFDAGVCDYCAIWKYPFRVGIEGVNDKQKLIDKLQEEIDLIHERAPETKIVWVLQSFAQAKNNLRMPNAEEMRELAEVVYAMDIDGAVWYPWEFGSLYSDTLVKHPELYPTIREIYDEIVLPLRE